MSYLKGTEDELKGFGAIPDLPSIEKNPCLYNRNSDACKIMQATIEKELDDIYAKAGSKIQGIANQNPVLAQALAGARKPDEIWARAQQLGNAFKGNISEKEAYKLFYIYGRSGFDMLESFSSIGLANTVQTAVNFGISEIPEIKERDFIISAVPPAPF